jgi:hypothetical protein
MGTPNTTTATCDDCGKIYRVAPAMAGKRVKCKACGNAFQIPQCKAPMPVVVKQDSYGTAVQHAAAAAVAPSSGRETLRIVVDYLLYFKPCGWVLLACLVIAVLLGFEAGRVPNLFLGSLYGFPILAGIFLIVGTAAALVSAILSPEEFKAPWSHMFSLAIRLVIGGVIGIFVYRRGERVDDDDFGLFFHRMVPLIFRVLGVAAMSLVCGLTAFATDSLPKNPPTALQLRAQKVLEQQQHPSMPMRQIPFPPFSGPSKSTIDRMRQ